MPDILLPLLLLPACLLRTICLLQFAANEFLGFLLCLSFDGKTYWEVSYSRGL